jgi:hypothetical protein
VDALEKTRRLLVSVSRTVRRNFSAVQVARASISAGRSGASLATLPVTASLNAFVSTIPRPLMISCIAAP